MMKGIIFLFLVVAAGSVADANTECRDVLGHCNVVKANCKSPQAQTQMKKLCAKTCGFCKEDKEEMKAPAPKQSQQQKQPSTEFTLELFLLYIKNDIKFLKEEITDVKFRLRDLSNRKQVVTSSAVQQREDPRLAGELTDLKLQTQRLATRIQDQTDRFSSMLSNFSLNLNTVKQNFTGEIIKIQRDILELAEELRRDAGKIESLDNLDDQIKDVRDDIDIMNQQTRVYIASFNDYFRNLSSNVAERFLKLQEQFYNVLNEERIKVIELGIRLENVTDTLHKERERTAKLERLINAFSGSPNVEILGVDQQQIEELTMRMGNFSRMMRRQEVKTSMLTALVEEIQKKPVAASFEEERAKINQLQSKFSYAMRRVDILVQKTNYLQEQLNQTRRGAPPSSPDPRVDELLTQLNAVTDQLEALKSNAARNQISGTFQKMMEMMKNRSSSSSPAGDSVQDLRMFNRLAVDVDALKIRVSDDTSRIDALTKKVDEVTRNTTSGIFGIKRSIESMADLRNNESMTIGELKNKYQQGIMSLLGPQQANNTRFYKPRFDWENGRLTIYGYIAINRQGEWGTICDDSFDEKEAMVLCRQAGYKGGAYENGKYKISDGMINGKARSEHRIWIDELRCEGTELSLEDCRHGSEGWGVHDCDHGEDVGIKCFIS